MLRSLPVLAVLFPLLLQAQEPLIITDDRSIGFIGDRADLLEDPTAQLGLPAVLASTGFKRSDVPVYNFGLSRSRFWIRATVINKSSAQNLYVYVPHPEVEFLTVHVMDAQGRIASTEAGESIDLSLAPMRDNDLVVPLSVPVGGQVTLFIQTWSYKQLQLPLTIVTPMQLTGLRSRRDMVVGVYLGIMLVLLLYNFFVYLSIRDRSYLIYVIYLLAVALTQATFLGLTKCYLWPDRSWWSVNASMIFTVATAITAGEFMRAFLQLSASAPLLSRILRGGYVLLLAGLLVRLTIDPLVGYNMLQGIAGLLAVFQLFVALRASRSGSRPARYFLLAWSVFLLGVIVYVMKDFGVLPYNDLTKYTMPLGSAIEGVLLSFALADKINILRREKERSQAEALRVSVENERIIREQNVMLEEKVTERTRELRESNEDLKRTQSQLVNAEKMASLGQLTAGIAHEMNNPVNFISSNIPPLRRNITEMLGVLQRYRSIGAGMTTPEVKDLQRTESELGIDDSVAETTDILNSIENGASRTAEIVRGLRNFSRLDESDLKAADVNECLRSTLAVLSPQVRDKVRIEQDLGALPVVECYPGKLNQVFMNILTNAAQASRMRFPQEGGIVTVRTRTQGDHVEIIIGDNGSGFSPEVKTRMFEPFFTTKGVGEGTGLGLSIAYGIIEKHNGSIEADCEPGMGATFRMVLPINQQQAAQRA